jgi:hypothetical protein
MQQIAVADVLADAGGAAEETTGLTRLFTNNVVRGFCTQVTTGPYPFVRSVVMTMCLDLLASRSFMLRLTPREDCTEV